MTSGARRSDGIFYNDAKDANAQSSYSEAIAPET